MSGRKVIIMIFGLIFAINLNNAECAIFGANQSIASGGQINPAIVVDPNGNIFIVWERAPFTSGFVISAGLSSD